MLAIEAEAHPEGDFLGVLGSVIPGMPTGTETSSVTDTEADEMEEHLRGLGYLE